MEDNWIKTESQQHKKAVEFLEKNRKKLEKKPVRVVPMGFSYWWEKIKKKRKK